MNLYQWADIQDKKDYTLDNSVDFYTLFFGAAVVFELVAIIVMFKNECTPLISNFQHVVLSVIVGLFQTASFYMLALFTSELFISIQILGDDLCK